MSTSKPTKASVFLDMVRVAYVEDRDHRDAVRLKAHRGLQALFAALRQLPCMQSRERDIELVVRAAKCGDLAELEQMAGLATLLDQIHDRDYLSALFEAGFTPVGHYHPRFIAAMEELQHIRDTQGDEALHAEEHARLFITVHRYAPPSMQDEMLKMARSMGLIPAAEFVNEKGEPVFTAEQIAAVHGISVEEVEAHIAKLVAAGVFDADHIGSGPVHRVQ